MNKDTQSHILTYLSPIPYIVKRNPKNEINSTYSIGKGDWGESSEPDERSKKKKKDKTRNKKFNANLTTGYTCRRFRGWRVVNHYCYYYEIKKERFFKP